MKPKFVALGGVIIASGIVAGIMLHQRYSALEASRLPKIQRAENGLANSQPTIVESLPIKPRIPQIALEKPAVSIQPTAAAPGTNAPTKVPLQDPIARDALALVGSDPEAELYWVAAINDLSLPANERQDLIEDLNEEGLSDPKNPTIDDLPLIFNRLAIIETIGPDAADQVNADAFAEAYKDLLNLAQVAMGGGEPVK